MALAKIPFVSFIVPVFNENNVISVFVSEIKKYLEFLRGKYELIFINDGSTDNTLEILLKHRSKNTKIKIIDFSRNFGKDYALTAGFEIAVGDVVIPLDVDMQDPLYLIKELVEKWREGFEVVECVRTKRKDGVIKNISANFFYKIMSKLSCVSITHNSGDYRLIDRVVIDAIKSSKEKVRFMKGLYAWAGFKRTEVYYERPERISGSSKWSYWKLWQFAIDGITGFCNLPLRLWSIIGFVISFIAFVYGVILFIKAIVSGIDTPGYTSIMLVILLLGGLQMLSFGILCEYISRIFIEVKNRPPYIIKAKYGID